MKLNDIRKFVKETIPEFIDCSIDVMKNMATEIKSAIKFIISTPKLLLNFMFDGILKPREAHSLNFKEQPLGSLFLYIYSIISKPFVVLNGKSIKESADLIDYKYTRWCIAIYLTLASTYWIIEIGIPHWDGPKTDFQQLMTHEALVNLTVVFGASMGLIALLHRSIVSDYQIKQQNQSEIISNFYSISKHIIDNAGEIFTSTSSLFKIKPSTIPSLVNNIFEDSIKGDYTVSRNLTDSISEISSTLAPFPIKKDEYITHTNDRSLRNIIKLIGSSENLSNKIIQTFSLSYGHLLFSPPREIINYKHNSKKILIAELCRISEILNIEIHIELQDIRHTINNPRSELIISRDIYATTLAIINSIEHTLLLLPIPIESTNHFFSLVRRTKTLLSDNLAFVEYILESVQDNINKHHQLIFLLAARDIGHSFLCSDDELDYLLFNIKSLNETYGFNPALLINYILRNRIKPPVSTLSENTRSHNETAHNI